MPRQLVIVIALMVGASCIGVPVLLLLYPPDTVVYRHHFRDRTVSIVIRTPHIWSNAAPHFVLFVDGNGKSHRKEHRLSRVRSGQREFAAHEFPDVGTLLIVESGHPNDVIVALDCEGNEVWPDSSLPRDHRVKIGTHIVERVNARHATEFVLTDFIP